MWWICFFKQKTAYVRRISDWSSDVCSSDRLRHQNWSCTFRDGNSKMTKIDLIDGELDFHERMKQLGELFCRIVYSKLADGKEPSNIANLLADYAEHSQNCSDRQATNVQADRKSTRLNSSH